MDNVTNEPLQLMHQYNSHAPLPHHQVPQQITLQIDMSTLLQAFTSIISTLCDTLTHQQQHTTSVTLLLDNNIHKHTPALSGIICTNLYSWSGLMDDQPLPPFWHAFQSANNDGTQIQLLDSFLEKAHWNNFHVQYTIWQEFIQDIKSFCFHFPARL